VSWLNLRVDISKRDRALFVGESLAVYWLALPGNTLPAQKEYAQGVDDTKVQAALAVVDQLALNNEPIPSSRLEKVSHRKETLWVFKAPQRGTRIYRLLCHRHQRWEFYVALAAEKRGQELPRNWKDTAAERVKRSLAAGGP
jgi:hypothetical protein